jgi:hypothetical protein
MTGEELEDWALNDRNAKVLIGAMLVFEVAFLLVTMLWL